MAMKKLLKLLSLCMISILVLPITMAYYNHSTFVENIFNTNKTIGVGIEEVFTPVDDWLPGESKQKEVWFTNPSNAPVLIRMKYQEGWYDKDGHVTNLEVKNVVKDWAKALHDEWVLIGDYYYYKKVLGNHSQTNPILNKLILEPVSNDGHSDDYSNKNYKLEFIVEGCRVDSDAVKMLFDIDVTIDGENVSWKVK